MSTQLSPWMQAPEATHCWMRVVADSDPTQVENRKVFIEKSPRVFNAHKNEWAYGPKGDGDLCGLDPNSRAWADAKALSLGYGIPMVVDFDTIYKTHRMLFCNPDSADVLAFLWTHMQVVYGKDLNDLSEEIYKNREETDYAYPKTLKGNI